MGNDPSQDVEAIFEQFGDLFQDLFSAANAAASDRGDVAVALQLTPEAAARGVTESVAIETDCDDCEPVPCEACNGSGQHATRNGDFVITRACTTCHRGSTRLASCVVCRGRPLSRTFEVVVPPGVVSGQALRLAGQGRRTANGVGDVYVNITVDDVELPRALVRLPPRRTWPMALALAAVIGVAAALSLLW